MPHHRVHIIELSPFGKFNLRRSLDDERNFHGVETAVESRGKGMLFDLWREEGSCFARGILI